MSQLYPPYNIYLNIIEYHKYGRLEMISPIMTSDEIKNVMQSEDFVIIKSKDLRDDRLVYIFIFNTNDRIIDTKKSANFKKIFETYPKPEDIKIIEYIFITETELKKQLRNNILSEALVRNARVKMYPYIKFKIVLPKAVDVFPHEIVPESEHMQLLKDISVGSKSNMAQIKINDPQAIWLRARIGDIIRILRKTESTMVSPYYRVCVA